MSKGQLNTQGQGHRTRKCKNRFSRISSSKMNRFFTSNQYQNDHRAILHIIVQYISRAKSFCLFVGLIG